jgi:hypothetical protein
MRCTRRHVLSFPLALVPWLILGCGGGSESTGPGGSGDHYLRFQANGAQVSYTEQSSLLMTFSNSGTQYVGIVSGFDATSNANLQIYANAAISTGTWSGYNLSGSALVGALIGYHPAGGVLHTSGGTGVVTASVTISEITGTTARGTFTATLRAAGQPDITVTNGEFFVPRFN